MGEDLLIEASEAIDEEETQVADQGLWIAGRKAVALISTGDDGTRVRLDGGLVAVLPPGSDAIAKAMRLPTEAAAPPSIPSQVTNAQARAALRSAKLLDMVQAVIDAHPDLVVRDAWEYAPVLSRDAVLVASLGDALKLTKEQIDGLFRAAAAVKF